MTARRPLVVVSLPGRSVAAAVGEIGLAREAGADAAEIRLDRWPREERERVGTLFPSALPLVATFRSRAEGGEGPDDPETRSAELLRVAELPFRWIDLEFGRDLGVVSRLPPPSQLGRIISCHLGPSDAGRWAERWLDLSRVDGVGKLVVPASVPVALDEIVPRLAERRDATVTVLTVGGSGPVLRALSGRLGAPLVYASLPEGSGAPPVEPSQVPVDRLRPFLDADGEPPIFAVVGRPVAHSSSPAVHTRWMRAEGREGLYVALEFADDSEFLRSVPPLAANGFRGLNVTQPFKFAAFEAATETTPGATACRAANCLALREDGVVAENTDLAAILRRLEELRSEGRWAGDRLLVIGAGGAARATLAAARELGARAQVVDRRPERATRIAEEFGATPADPSAVGPERLVVHATSAGRSTSGPLELPLGRWLGPTSHVLDWVYRPDEKSVANATRQAGATYEDGWRLFVYQAAAAYAFWWGEEPPGEEIERTIGEGPCAG